MKGDKERGRVSRRSRSGSRSPLRSKVSVVKPPVRGRERERRGSSRSKSDKIKSNTDKHDRSRADDSRTYRGEHDNRDKEVREDRSSGGLKRNSNSVFADLDRAVKKAREERNTIGYWNKKVIEAEERDPNRWGHSGFKELYSRDIDEHGSKKKGVSRRSRSRSRSRSRDSKRGRRSPDRRNVGRQSRSRSRSPMLKQLYIARKREAAESRLKPLMPKGYLSSEKSSSRKAGTGSSGKIQSLLSLPISPPKKLNSFRSRHSPEERRRNSDTLLNRSSGSSRVKPRVNVSSSAAGVRRRVPRRSDSYSHSDSDSSRSPSPPTRKPLASKPYAKGRPSNKSNSRSGSRTGRRSRSKRSDSPTSSSSSDEDVLELHPRRRRSYSISHSDSSSSDSDTSGSIRKPPPKRRRMSGSPTSSSSSGSETDHSTAMAKDKDRLARNLPSPLLHSTTGTSSKNGKSQPVRKSVPAAKTPGSAAKNQTSGDKSALAAAGKAKQIVKQPASSTTTKPGDGAKKSTVASNQKVSSTQKKPTGQSQVVTKQPVKSSTVPNAKPTAKQTTAGKPVSSAKVSPQKQSDSSKRPVTSSSGKKPTQTTTATKPSTPAKKVGSTSLQKNNSKGEGNRQRSKGSDIDSDSSADVQVVGKKKGRETAKASSDKGKSGKASSKEEGESSDSDSGSDSSSGSDSEPRMTLSERFAKLTQMNTDKREFAKPVLSPNEMDTKLKVVKDLRGQAVETKVYVNAPEQQRGRPKSPDFGDSEGRYPSDERRRRFERMSRDTPNERPADWTNITARYNFYKDRGCFDERPLTLEEYSKWESWYYEYKEWLENEERYVGEQRMIQEDDLNIEIPRQEFGGIGSRLGWHPNDRNNRPSMSSRLDQRIVRSPPNNRQFFGPGGNHPEYGGGNDRFSRRIGHAPSGSLVVNIRQEEEFGRQRMPIGRRLGIPR